MPFHEPQSQGQGASAEKLRKPKATSPCKDSPDSLQKFINIESQILMDSKLNELQQLSEHSSDTEGENFEAKYEQNIMNKIAYYNARDSIH